MPLLPQVAENWQKALPYLSAAGVIGWIALFRSDPLSEQALFAGLLVIYLLHQIEEHLWPGGFRQSLNTDVFHSGNDNWPVDKGGVAFVNIVWVWLPIGLAALLPATLRFIGLAWLGLTLVNGIIHIVSAVRLRSYNPGLVTSIVLFLPFTIFVLVREAARGMLSDGEIAAIVVAGIVLHLPVVALFAVSYWRGAADDPRRGVKAAE
jgi:hypothetical protein